MTKKARIDIHPLTKDVLRSVLLLCKSDFNRYLKDTHDAIIEKFPYYNRYQKILPEDIFSWICLVDRRMNPDIVFSRIMAYYPDYKKEDYPIIANCYGFYSLSNIPNVS